MKDFCPVCHSIVAPHAPSRTTYLDVAFHRICLQRAEMVAHRMGKDLHLVWREGKCVGITTS